MQEPVTVLDISDFVLSFRYFIVNYGHPTYFSEMKTFFTPDRVGVWCNHSVYLFIRLFVCVHCGQAPYCLPPVYWSFAVATVWLQTGSLHWDCHTSAAVRHGTNSWFDARVADHKHVLVHCM